MKFEELDLSPEVLDALDAMGFDECTPIQEKAIPIVLENNDLIAVAQTGTGKTAAYLLPVISRLYDDGAPTDAVNCVVMAPTRELVQQIDRQLEGFSYYLDLSSVAIYGGTDGPVFAQQQQGLREGADVVVATPGRLLAHLQMGYVDLSRVRYFILDEADRMLDMGFYDDIMQVVRHLPEQRTTLMFSATMPPKIKKLAKSILHSPREVRLSLSRPGENIDQAAIVCHEPQKIPVLEHLFGTFHSKRVIVFASSKIKCKELSRALRRNRINAAEIHSDLDQTARDRAILDFRAGRADVLVATDIVARGIDIDDITMVVNFDVPHEVEDYVHRIGRTARAGAEGKAVTLVCPQDFRRFAAIEDFLGHPVNRLAMPDELGETPAFRPSQKGDRQKGARNLRHGRQNRKGGAQHNNTGGNPAPEQPKNKNRQNKSRKPNKSKTQNKPNNKTQN